MKWLKHLLIWPFAIMGLWVIANGIWFRAQGIHEIPREAVSAAEPQAFATALSEVFEKAGKSIGLEGFLFLEKDGRLLLGEIRGSFSASEALTDSSPLLIGSLSKQFLAAAVLRLVDQGRMRLEQRVCEQVPELCESAVGALTFREILSHTAGLPRDFGEGFAVLGELFSGSLSNRVLSREDWLARMKEVSLRKEKTYRYSNLGYQIASIAVERASGLPLGEALETLVFGPAGLRDTFLAKRDKEASFARRTRVSFVPLTRNFVRDSFIFPLPFLSQPVDNLMGAGGIASSARDLLSWARLLNERSAFLKAESWEALEEPVQKDYALGWVVEDIQGGRRIWHNGQWAGAYALLVRWPERKMNLVFLSNNDLSSREAFIDSIENLVRERPYHVIERTAFF